MLKVVAQLATEAELILGVHCVQDTKGNESTGIHSIKGGEVYELQMDNKGAVDLANDRSM